MEGFHGTHNEQYSYVEDEAEFASELICTVCHGVAGTHAACPGCSQAFCQNCVYKWFNTQKSNASACTCPYCRRKLKFSDLKHDAAIQQKLDLLQVYCPNRHAGCPAVTARINLPAHLSRDCLQQPCRCKFCGKTGLRTDIRQHEAADCPERCVPCSNAAAGCTEQPAVSHLQTHLEYICEWQERPCPRCHQNIPRRMWARHFERDCPAQQCCPLRLYGCTYSGSTEQVQQHCKQCPYAERREQLERQLLAGTSPAGSAAAEAASVQAVLANTDMSELPPGCVSDSRQIFDAPSICRSAAHASQLLMTAMPQSVLPPQLQDSNRLVDRVASAEQLYSPLVLATLTPPKQIAAAGTGTQPASSVAENMVAAACSGSSLPLTEVLALGGPQCFNVLGLESEPWLEGAWRIMHNIHMVDLLSKDMSELPQLPSSFVMYTSICRAWDTVVRILGPQQEQQQQERDQQGTSSGHGTATAAGAPQASPGAAAAVAGPAAATRGDSSGSSSSGDSQEDFALPGLERGLFEGEYEDLEGWVWHQRDMLQAVATVALHVLQLWMGLGGVMLVPGLQAELSALQHAGMDAAQLVAEVLSTKTTSKRASSGRDRVQDALAEQQQARSQEQQEELQQQTDTQQDAGWYDVRVDDGPRWPALGFEMMRRWTGRRRGQDAASQGANTNSNTANRQQQGSTASAAAVATAAVENVATSAGATSSSAAAAVPITAADVIQLVDYNTALQHLKRLGAGPALGKKRRIPELLQGRTPMEALELATAVLTLHHARQQHIEVSMIPQSTPILLHGFRAYWAPGILAGSRAWLGPRFKLSWQAVAVMNDMVMSLTGRFLDVLNEGFFDYESGRLPMAPRLAGAAVQLVLPPGLVAAHLPRVAMLSRAYHDEECDELSEVTWNTLQRRLGLWLELDKLVTLVDQHLPVQYYGDEDDHVSYSDDDDDDDDMQSEETELSTEDTASDSEYTTDDEYMQEDAQEHEQQQQQLLQQQQQINGTTDSAHATTRSTVVPITDPMAGRAGQQGHGGSPASAAERVSGSRGPWAGLGRREAASESSWESGEELQQHELPGQPAASTAANAAAGGGDSSGVVRSRSDTVGHMQQQQQRQAGSKGASQAGAAGAETKEALDVGMSTIEQQQQDEPQMSSRGVAAAAAVGPTWHTELMANLKQLGDPSHDLSQFEQQVLQEVGTWLEDPLELTVRQDAVRASADRAETPQQQQQNGPVPAATTEPPQQQLHRQHQQQREDKEGGDTTTHGVVILAGFVEAVLRQLLEAAAAEAAQQAGAVAAVGTASASTGGSARMLVDRAASEHAAQGVAGEDCSQQQAVVGISARHILLAAAANADLRTLLLDRPGVQNQSNPAAVAWAGVAPGFDPRLLPQPDKEPLTAWLYGLAAGMWQQQQQQQQHGADGSINNTSRVLFPADFQYYCGRTWSIAPSAAVHDSAASAADGCDHGLTCCFLSGRQCGECAAATAALPGDDMHALLEACKAGLTNLAVHAAVQQVASAPAAAAEATTVTGKAAVELTDWQLQQLIDAARLYHLQQQWWYGNAQGKSSKVVGGSSSSSSTCLHGGTGSQGPGWVADLSAVDQVQLANVQQLLQPLRDVVALREIQVQQAQGSQLRPAVYFEGVVREALETVAAQKQQQKALQLQMQQLIAPAASNSATTAAAAAMAGHGNNSDTATGAADEGSQSDDAMDIDSEALDVLATAAEDFLVQQFRGANELALHVGRQELQVQDLRLALAGSGYRHILQQLAGRSDQSCDW